MNSKSNIKNVLIVKSSPSGDDSVSNEIAEYLVDQLEKQTGTYNFTIRDLAKVPAPQLDRAILQAFFTAPDQLNNEQKALVAPSLNYINELKSADIIVFATAMHNFSVTALMKSYIDQICRADMTFIYGENGPQGLLAGKKGVIISSAGGDYQQEYLQAMDFQTPYLECVLNFIGIEDINVVPVQGMAMNNAVITNKAAAKNKIQMIAESL